MKKGIICLISLLMVFSLVGCGASAPMQQAAAVEKRLNVYCVKPVIGTLERFTSIVGKTVPQTSCNVTANITEEITKVYKKVGDPVKKGELLMELDATDLLKELETSKADFDVAKANVDKMLGSQLDSAVDGAQSGYDQLKNSMKVQEANLEVLETKIRNTRSNIRRIEDQISDLEQQKSDMATGGEDTSGIDKKINDLNREKAGLDIAKDQLEKSYDSSLDTYEKNEENLEDQKNLSKDILDVTNNEMKKEIQKTANAMLTLSEITYNNAVKKLDDTKIYSPIDGYVDFCNVKENNTVQTGTVAFTVSERQNALIEFNVSGIHASSLSVGKKIDVTNRDEDFTATITEIPPMVDSKTGLFKITASIDSNDQNFIFGANHFVKIPTENAQNAMTVPLNSVYFEGEDIYVYVAKDGVAIKTPVETGIYNDKDIQIISGLEATDDVITSWSFNLIDGAKIDIKQQTDEQATNETSDAEQAPVSPQEGEE